MDSKPPSLTENIRARLTERALAGAPQWLAPALPAARAAALTLMIGRLCERLPAEDARALIRAVVSEQNADGSWSKFPGGPADFSITLEIVEALTPFERALTRKPLRAAVTWLHVNRDRVRLEEQTVILLSAVTGVEPSAARKLLMPLARRWLLRKARSASRRHRSTALPLALSILTRAPNIAAEHCRDLLELQLLDGSWEGSVQSTVMAMAALRHAQLPRTDAAFERGWRFLRSLQLWNEECLIQNPCDLSGVMHAAAVRSLLVSGAEPELAAGSTLSLLHGARTSGGWSAGGMQPTDLLTTGLALDALSFAGDAPVETLWARRRAVILLLGSQNIDGGWPLYPEDRGHLRALLLQRGSIRYNRSRIDVTAIALQALAYSGVQERGEEAALTRGVDYLLRRQESNGIWRGDTVNSDVFATARALEALIGIADRHASGAIIKGIQALAGMQRLDGGWSDRADTLSTPHHTAWAMRALTGAPGVPELTLKRGRAYLEATLDESGLLWSGDSPAWPVAFCDEPVMVPDLTALWALEALEPLGIASRPRTPGLARTRSLFDRSR